VISHLLVFIQGLSIGFGGHQALKVATLLSINSIEYLFGAKSRSVVGSEPAVNLALVPPRVAEEVGSLPGDHTNKNYRNNVDSPRVRLVSHSLDLIEGLQEEAPCSFTQRLLMLNVIIFHFIYFVSIRGLRHA